MPDDLPPDTRFARSGPVNIAYQVMGKGPVNLEAVKANMKA